MQACIYEEYGTAEVVRVGEVARPRIGARDVLVRVRAAAVTTADWRFRASAFPAGFWLAGRLMLGLFRPRNPVLGMDFSGVVEAVGSRVTRFRVGERVFGSTSANGRGAHAEYVAVRDSDAVVATPAHLSDDDAAAVPFGGNAALAFLRDVAKVRPGQRVLIVGASGSVGSWAVQLARYFGAEVTAVCSAENAGLVRSLGASHVIDYATTPVAERGKNYDLIFDTVGVTRFDSAKHALGDAGVYLPIDTGVREMLQSLFMPRKGKHMRFAVSQNTREGLSFLLKLIERGAVKPVIDSVYGMNEIAAAHRKVESRHKRGSVIVRI